MAVAQPTTELGMVPVGGRLLCSQTAGALGGKAAISTGSGVEDERSYHAQKRGGDQ